MRILLAVLLTAHLVLAGLRVLPKHWNKRAEEIQRYQTEGRYSFYFREFANEDGQIFAWLAANTPLDGVLLWRGEWRGVLEFAPALLWPRLLVAESAVPVGTSRWYDRHVIDGALPDTSIPLEERSGQFVLVGHRDRVELVLR
jgi:hypothetical protein